MNIPNIKTHSLRTSVLFIVFNRPDSTKKVFEEIRKAKPNCLYVAADGPKYSDLKEIELINKVRKIATSVDWPCEVKTLFRENNLGCKEAVSSAISWFFKHEEQGIILEDDCLPHQDFFSFCEKMLNHYHDNENIFMITGNNFQKGVRRGNASYYFSNYTFIWGWATWRRAWQHYDGSINFWPQWKHTSDWTNKFPDKIERNYWAKNFDAVFFEKINTWDYPWTACIWQQGGLTITPNVNLVSNIGFGESATFTTLKNDKRANVSVEELKNIIHPANIIRDDKADKHSFNYFFGGRNLRFPLSLLNLPKKIILFLLKKLNFIK
jgi:hypothetical protein